jgi:hypothetical protein
MSSTDSIDSFARDIERQIQIGEAFLDGLPDFAYGRNIRLAEQYSEEPPVMPLNEVLENVEY